MVLVAKAFERQAGHESRALMNGMCPYKLGPRELAYPFHYVRIYLAGTIWEPGCPHQMLKSARTLILDFPSSRTKKCLLFKNHLVYGILLQQSEWVKTVIKYYFFIGIKHKHTQGYTVTLRIEAIPQEEKKKEVQSCGENILYAPIGLSEQFLLKLGTLTKRQGREVNL